MKRMRILVVVAAVMAQAMMVAAQEAQSMADVRSEAREKQTNLEGSWELDVVPAPGPGIPPPFKALITFSSGGGVIETILLPPVVPAHGEWIRTGRNRFSFVVVHPLLSAQGAHVATIRATSHIRMTSAEEFTATFDGNILDPAGNVIGPIKGTETGKRIRVD